MLPLCDRGWFESACWRLWCQQLSAASQQLDAQPMYAGHTPAWPAHVRPPQPTTATTPQDKWNIFDFFMVLLSVASVLLDFFTSADLSFMPLLRVLRVARIFRLIPKAKGLRCAGGGSIWRRWQCLTLHQHTPSLLLRC